jgi:hypothetical protein
MMRKVTASIIAAFASIVSAVSATTPTPLPTFDMTRTTAWQAVQPWNFQALLPIAMSVYSDPMGENGKIIVYGSIFISILVCLALRQEDILIPFIVLSIFGQAMYWGGFIPQAWGIWVIALVYILPATGIAYALYTTKRKG